MWINENEKLASFQKLPQCRAGTFQDRESMRAYLLELRESAYRFQ